MASWETKQLERFRIKSLLSKSLNTSIVTMAPEPILNCSLAPPSETAFEESKSERVSGITRSKGCAKVFVFARTAAAPGSDGAAGRPGDK